MKPNGILCNQEAEEGLLACCLVDLGAVGVIDHSLKLGITYDSFAYPTNELIWNALRDVHKRGEDVDEFSVATELNKKGNLDSIGGVVALNSIAARVQSSSGWKRFAEEVLNKQLARKAKAAAISATEKLNKGDDLAEVLNQVQQAFTQIQEKTGSRQNSKEEKLLAKVELFAFDASSPPVKRPPVISLNGHPVCKKGDLMAFMAPNKSGKSSSLAAMMASTFASQGSDCLGFSAPNPEGEGVLHLMTEESVEDHWDMVNRSLRRARVTAPPSWFKSYHLRRLNTQERRDFLFAKARKMAPLRLLILDGCADFVEDSNDLAECKWFVDELLALIDELDCAVSGTIHVNPSPRPSERDKGIGHLGSIIERKASSILLLKKEEKEGIGEIITINTKDARKGKSDNPPRFAWSEELSMHIRYIGPTDIVSGSTKQHGRSKVFTWEKLTSYFVEGMKPVADWQESDMINLAERAGCSSATVRRLAAKYLTDESGFGDY